MNAPITESAAFMLKISAPSDGRTGSVAIVSLPYVVDFFTRPRTVQNPIASTA